MRARYWALAVVFFGIGDVLTTAYGLSHGATELNPFAVAVLGLGGIGAIVLLKLGVFGFFVLSSTVGARVTTGRARTLWERELPFAVGVLGIVIVAHNLLALYGRGLI